MRKELLKTPTLKKKKKRYKNWPGMKTATSKKSVGVSWCQGIQAGCKLHTGGREKGTDHSKDYPQNTNVPSRKSLTPEKCYNRGPKLDGLKIQEK